MENGLFDILSEIQQRLKRATLLATLALTLGILLLPAALRVAPPGSVLWVLVSAMAVYVIVAAYRLLGCFQVERQLDFEYRFLRFANQKGRLLDSAEAAGKIWKLSCLVHGTRKARSAALPVADGPARLRSELRSASRLMVPPAFRRAIPALALVGAAATLTAWSISETKLTLMGLIILPILIALSITEWRLLRYRKPLIAGVDRLIAGVGDWGAAEWEERPRTSGGRGYRHRVVFRDALRAS